MTSLVFQGTPLEESASQLRDEGSSPGWGAKTHTPQLERARATKRPHSSTEGPAHGSRDLTQTKNTHTHTRWDNAQGRAAQRTHQCAICYHLAELWK